MKTESHEPRWDNNDPCASLLSYAEWLHGQAVDMFLEDKTHAHILFMFTVNDGLVSVNPLPPDATERQILDGIRRTVQGHNVSGVITIAEAWAYFPTRTNDHTVVQLMHNEMRVADLKDEDKVECLMVRMERKDGTGIVRINKILRDGDDVSLGDVVQLPLDRALKQDRYFV